MTLRMPYMRIFRSVLPGAHIAISIPTLAWRILSRPMSDGAARRATADCSGNQSPCHRDRLRRRWHPNCGCHPGCTNASFRECDTRFMSIRSPKSPARPTRAPSIRCLFAILRAAGVNRLSMGVSKLRRCRAALARTNPQCARSPYSFHGGEEGRLRQHQSRLHLRTSGSEPDYMAQHPRSGMRAASRAPVALQLDSRSGNTAGAKCSCRPPDRNRR